MSGIGGRLWIALALSYLALGLFAGLVYEDPVTGLSGAAGTLILLGVAVAVAWAAGVRRG